MTAQEIIDYLRVHVLRDAARPYLWDDDLLLLRLNSAYARFCRETGVFVDDEVVPLSLSPNEHTYEIPTTVLLVKSVQLDIVPGELQNYTRRNLPAPSTTDVGTPIAFALDDKTFRLRFYPTPDTAYEATLRVMAELPELTVDDEPRIAARYHKELAHGVAAECLADNDADGNNVPAADAQKAKFEEFLLKAKRDVYRYRMGDAPRATQNWTGKRG